MEAAALETHDGGGGLGTLHNANIMDGLHVPLDISPALHGSKRCADRNPGRPIDGEYV
jgi:hypothetical protein